MRSYIAVEGPHDAEAVGRFLRQRNLKRVTQIRDLDSYWIRLVPKSYPHNGDLAKRMPVPVFFAANGKSVAVQSAGGIANITTYAQLALDALDEPPDSVGIVLDADDKDPKSVWESLVKGLPDLDLGDGPGNVSDSSPRAGAFVLPDNRSHGTLETLLLECAGVAYPELLKSAQTLVDGIDIEAPPDFRNREDKKDLSKPAGRQKATTACIAGVLRPGRAIQVSIQDNRWFRDKDALKLPLVLAFQEFVDTLLS